MTQPAAILATASTQPREGRCRLSQRNRVEQLAPGDYSALQVRYVAIAGQAILGQAHGGPIAPTNDCAAMAAEPVWGDGLVSLPSALLAGAEHIISEGARHYCVRGQMWYGSASVVK